MLDSNRTGCGLRWHSACEPIGVAADSSVIKSKPDGNQFRARWFD